MRPSNASPLRPITNNKGFLEPAIIPPLGTRDEELQSLIKEQNKVRDKIAELDESQRIEPKYMKARPWLYMNSEKKEDQKYEKYTAVDDDQVYKDFLKKLDDDKKQISEFQHDDDAYMEFVNK